MSMLLFFLGTICVGYGLSVVSSGNGNCASNLVATKKGLNEVSAIVKELQITINACTNNDNPYLPVPKMVAFTAILSKSISLGGNQVIRYDNVITNVGKAYTSSTGIFLVPLSGIYALSVSMMGHPDNGIHLQLVRNGTELVRLWTGGAKRYELASHTINVDLTRGDSVWVQRIDGAVAKIYGDEPYNIFSAALLSHT